jgi:RimJ/RimL family protein N-acetyltransferase
VRFPDEVPLLTDGTVTLRPHTLADAEGCYEQCQDLVSQRWTAIPVPYGRVDAEEFVGKIVPAGWTDDTEWAFAVEAADEGGAHRFAGTVSLRDRGERRAEVAFGSHPWARGRGLMTRAVDLLLDWGFEERRLETVIWWANKGNWASRKLAWRLGFTTDALVPQWLPQRGELLDAWVGSLRATDARAPRHRWYDAPTVHGERVLLRPHQPRDAVRLQRAGDDPVTQQSLQHFAAPFTTADAQSYLDQRAELAATGRGVHWTAADPVTDEALCFLGLFGVKAGHEAEIGYFTHPEARGRGLTAEAVALACRHAFVPEADGGLGLRRLRLLTDETNHGSQAVAARAGFTLVGRERAGTRMRDGSFVDELHYDLLAEELNAPLR